MDIDDALQIIQENIGCAFEMELLPQCNDGEVAYRAVLRDEYGECADGVGASLVDAISNLAGNFYDWLEEQNAPDPDAYAARLEREADEIAQRHEDRYIEPDLRG